MYLVKMEKEAEEVVEEEGEKAKAMEAVVIVVVQTEVG